MNMNNPTTPTPPVTPRAFIDGDGRLCFQRHDGAVDIVRKTADAARKYSHVSVIAWIDRAGAIGRREYVAHRKAPAPNARPRDLGGYICGHDRPFTSIEAYDREHPNAAATRRLHDIEIRRGKWAGRRGDFVHAIPRVSVEVYPIERAEGAAAGRAEA